jgi:16S rRNA C967 or C1407 C5-methylase (RsmB/RsmF family)
MRKDGRLLYITCSLLRQENEEQIKLFTKLHNLEVVDNQLMKITPQKDGSDGFFAVVLKRAT